MSTDFTTPINYSGPDTTSMAIDAIGNFYLVSAESPYEWNVSAYDSGSNLKWQLPLGSKGCMAITHSGNLIVAHATKHPDRWHETVISIEEYTPGGELQSRRLIPEANEYISFLRIAGDGAIILGANHEIYVDSRHRGYTAFYRMDDLETSPISKSVIDAFAVNRNDILSEEGIYSRHSTTDELSISTYYPYYPNWDTFFEATSAGVDSAGATVIAGIFRDNSAPRPMLHHDDYFLAKFDREGNIEWIQTAGKRRIEGNSGDDYVKNIAIDDSGNIYICGIILDLI